MSQGWTEDHSIQAYEQEQDMRAGGQSLRMKWAVLLVAELERIEYEFIMGGNRDKYNEELQDLDEKLAIIGFRLSSRPWQTQAPKPRTGV